MQAMDPSFLAQKFSGKIENLTTIQDNSDNHSGNSQAYDYLTNPIKTLSKKPNKNII